MKQLFSPLLILLISVSAAAQQIKTVTAVRASTFTPAQVTLQNDSVFNAWVSVKSTAYDGYVNHLYYLVQQPADSNVMLPVAQLPVLNHTNLKKISYPDGNSFFFQKLSGCIANCYFLRRVLLENEKVLLTSAVTDDLQMLMYASTIKVPYTVFIQFKTGDEAGKIQQLTYIPKMFPGKSKNKLAKLFHDYPVLAARIKSEEYANNISGLLALLEDFGKG